MAIEDVLMSFNPMDIVRGYEYGIERGQQRERNEEELKRQRLFNQIAELQNVPAARLSGMETGARIEALESLPGMRREQRRREISTEFSKTLRGSAEEAMLLKTQPERLESREREEFARTSPARTDVRITEAAAGERARAGQAGVAATTFEGLQADQAAAAEATSLLQAAEASERDVLAADPTAARTDPWDRVDSAIRQTQNPRAQALLQKQRDDYALRAMTGAARAGDADTMNLYMQRYGKNLAVERVTTTDAQGRQVAAWQLFALQPGTDAQGQQTLQRVPVEGGYFSVDANNRNWIGYQLPGLLGLGEGAPQRGQTRGRSPALPRAPAAPRQPTPRAAKAAAVDPAEAANAAAGRRAPGPITPQQKQDLDEFNRRQRRLLNLSESYDRLSSDEQLAVARLADQSARVARLMETPEGNTDVNRVLLNSLNRQLAAIFPAPKTATA